MTLKPGDYVPANLWIEDYYGPYPGEVATFTRWNGWAVPRFKRPAVEQIIATMTDDETNPDRTEFEWDGDVLLIKNHSYRESDPDDWIERLEPRDGWYSVGAMSWTWDDDHDTSCVYCGSPLTIHSLRPWVWVSQLNGSVCPETDEGHRAS